MIITYVMFAKHYNNNYDYNKMNIIPPLDLQLRSDYLNRVIPLLEKTLSK